MRRLIDNDYLTMLVRVAVGTTFIVASYYKIVVPGDFARSIWYYHLVPGDLINLMALMLPWAELICGLCLIFGGLYEGAVVLVNLMTLVFIAALSSAVYRGIDIDCGCFKAATEAGDSALRSLVMDLVLLVLALQLLTSRSTRWRLAAPRSR